MTTTGVGGGQEGGRLNVQFAIFSFIMLGMRRLSGLETTTGFWFRSPFPDPPRSDGLSTAPSVEPPSERGASLSATSSAAVSPSSRSQIFNRASTREVSRSKPSMFGAFSPSISNFARPSQGSSSIISTGRVGSQTLSDGNLDSDQVAASGFTSGGASWFSMVSKLFKLFNFKSFESSGTADLCLFYTDPKEFENVRLFANALVSCL